MSQRLINIGTGPNTKDGDTVRHAFDLVNQNFDEVYSLLGQGSNNGLVVADIEGSLWAADSTLIVDAVNNTITTNELTVNGTVTLNLQNGTLVIRGSEPITYGLNPNDAPHLHIEAADPTTTDLFLGDDSQFVRVAIDGSIIVNARLGTSSPAVIKGSDGVMVNNGTAIDNISLQDINVVISIINHGLVEGDKLYFENIEGTTELNDTSFYATNINGDLFELLDTNSDPILSSNVTAWVPDTGVIYSATKGGDVIINAGGLDDAYGDEGVVEVYGKTVSITTQTNNTWMFDGVNLTLPSGGDILDSEGSTVLSGGGGPLALNDLTDVVAGEPDVNNKLGWNGTAWVPQTTDRLENGGGILSINGNTVQIMPPASQNITIRPGNSSSVITLQGNFITNVEFNNPWDVYEDPPLTAGLNTNSQMSIAAGGVSISNSRDTGLGNDYSHAWTFDNNGDLLLPVGGDIRNNDGTLYSNGGGNTGDLGFVDNAMYNFNGVIVENSDLTHGATAALTLPTNGSSTSPIELNNTYGNIKIQPGISGALTTWTFKGDGTLTFPDNTIQSSAYRIYKTPNYNVSSGNASTSAFLIGMDGDGHVIIQNFYEYGLTYIISGTKTLSGVTTNIYISDTVVFEGANTIDTLVNVGDNLQFVMQVPDPGAIYRVTVCATWSGIPYCSVIIEQLQ